MPAGEEGDRLTIRATVIVVVVVAQVVYGSLGVFGAARHGLATAGNILGNQWLPARAQVRGLPLRLYQRQPGLPPYALPMLLPDPPRLVRCQPEH